MNRPKAWKIAKPFIEEGTIEYFSDRMYFEMTGTNYELYKSQCATNYVLPLEAKKNDNGWLFEVKYNDVREVQI